MENPWLAHVQIFCWKYATSARRMSEDFLRESRQRRRNLREREHGNIFASENRIHLPFYRFCPGIKK